MTWLIYVLITVVCWGLYGIFLHKGQMLMGDPANGRYKAFLLVGVAYFVVAVLAPAIVLIKNGASINILNYPAAGNGWSFFAGVLGAIGAFGVLLALGALFATGNKNAPAVVMSLVFAFAPVVNAAVALTMHPPAGGWGSIRWPFYAGILMAAFGGFLVTYFKPGAPPAKPAAVLEDAADPGA